MEVYIRAKAEADAAVQASDRDWRLLRPGRLTDEGGTEKVRIGAEPFYAPLPRDDVAGVLACVLPDTRSSGRTLYRSSGTQSIEHALDTELGATT
jgi:uncharacterized protein YbjT (DUF2867 family)